MLEYSYKEVIFRIWAETDRSSVHKNDWIEKCEG